MQPHAQQKPKLVTTSASQKEPRSDELRREAIATAAYYRALARNFEPGHELEDWVAAEHEVAASGRTARTA